MNIITLEPAITTFPIMKGKWESKVIEKEPMFFNSSVEFAERNGGDLTRAVINELREEVRVHCPDHLFPVIDTRSHMLMKGMYPAIPGWHCDAVRRNLIGQPEFKYIDSLARHYSITISDQNNGVSGTEFIREPLDVEYDFGRVWGSIDEYICKNLKPKTLETPDGVLNKFNQTTLHRATPAKQNGWRWFFRLSFYHASPVNKIRNQTQVYTTSNLGW